MKILIVYYSLSKITKKIVEILKDRLTENFFVDIFEIVTDPPLTVKTLTKNFEIVSTPSLDNYDFIFVGGPVWAFGLNYPILKYLENMKNIQNKKFLLFVTMGFPFKFMGGERALKIMESIIMDKKGIVVEKFCFNRLFHNIFKEAQNLDMKKFLK